MSWISLALVNGLLVLTGRSHLCHCKCLSSKYAKLIDRLNLAVRENLNGMTVIPELSVRKILKRNVLIKQNMDVVKRTIYKPCYGAFLMPAMTFIVRMVFVYLLFDLVHTVANGGIQVGDMMAFLHAILHAKFIIAFLMLPLYLLSYPRAAVSQPESEK